MSLKEDHAVILSSHILQEISAVCDYVIMISRGKVVASDDIDSLVGEDDTLENVFINLAGESLDAGAAYAAQKELEREARGRGRKKIKVDSDKGAAYYTEVYADEDNESPVLLEDEEDGGSDGADSTADEADTGAGADADAGKADGADGDAGGGADADKAGDADGEAQDTGKGGDK